MKKLSSVLAFGLALSLTLGMTAFAASPSTGSVATPQTSAPTGNSVTAEVDSKTQEQVDAYVAANSAVIAVQPAGYRGGVAVVNGNSQKIDYTVKAVDNAALLDAQEKAASLTTLSNPQVVGGFDVSANTSVEGAKYEVTVVLSNFNYDANAKYTVLHLHDGVWYDNVDATVGSGFVTIKVDNFSNFVIVKSGEAEPEENGDEEESEEESSEESNDAASTTSAPAASPKTGETIPVAGTLAVICLAGAYVCLRKENHNK